MTTRRIIISEAQLHKIVRGSLLSENRESKNIELARRYLTSNGYEDPEDRQRILEYIRTCIPNSRLEGCKFLLGVTRLYIDKQLSDHSSIANLNKDLKYIASDAHKNEYDSNLNGMSAEEIHNRFATNISDDYYANVERSNARSLTRNSEYEIVRIPSFEEAEKYGGYVSWCVTQDENAYNSYTNGGSGLFYFCLKKGFENLPERAGNGCPLDEYGLSMIAVSVDSMGEMNTITCRWNHDNGGTDQVMSVDQLEDILGMNFYQTFKPYSKEELVAKGRWISEKIGELYDDGKVKGIIASVDADENPRLILAMDDLGNGAEQTWYDAMELGKTLKDGWHIPTKEEFEEIWHDNGEITKRLNRGLKKNGGETLDYRYWSSSEYSSYNAWFLNTYNGNVNYNNKTTSYRVRPVLAL